eukprot:365125-Chlamydomonas_euryale.AAC.2
MGGRGRGAWRCGLQPSAVPSHGACTRHWHEPPSQTLQMTPPRPRVPHPRPYYPALPIASPPPRAPTLYGTPSTSMAVPLRMSLELMTVPAAAMTTRRQGANNDDGRMGAEASDAPRTPPHAPARRDDATPLECAIEAIWIGSRRDEERGGAGRGAEG